MDTRRYTVAADDEMSARRAGQAAAEADGLDPLVVVISGYMGEEIVEGVKREMWSVRVSGTPISESERRALAGDR